MTKDILGYSIFLAAVILIVLTTFFQNLTDIQMLANYFIAMILIVTYNHLTIRKLQKKLEE